MALSEDDRAALSAYLDGELDDEATHQLEVRLARDPDLRIEYDTLRQTWSLLDYLPRAAPSLELTHRTLSRITRERYEGSATWVGSLARRVPTLTIAWAAGLLLAAGVGVALGGWLTVPAVVDSASDDGWVAAQPRALRDKLAALPVQERVALIQRLREEEQKQREAWQVAARDWKRFDDGTLPTRFADLSPVEQEGVKEFLLPLLSDKERQRLADAEHKYPEYAQTLVDLADRHPLALPGEYGPTELSHLPEVVRLRFDQLVRHPNKSEKASALLAIQGKGVGWPKYGEVVVRLYQSSLDRANGPLPREFWACNKKSLMPPMRAYLEQVFEKQLTDTQKEPLRTAEGNWPAYPLAIQTLANKHKLPPPPWWTVLSDAPAKWEPYRTVPVNSQPAPRPAKREGAKLRLPPANHADAKLQQFGKLLFLGAKKLSHAHERERDRRFLDRD